MQSCRYSTSVQCPEYSCSYKAGAWCLRRGRAGTDARRALSRCPARRSSGGFAARAFSDTRPARTCTLHSRSYTHALRFSRPSTVSSARRTFELFAASALAYKYEVQWRGPASDPGASRIHRGLNSRCSRCPSHWFYCLSMRYIQLAKFSPTSYDSRDSFRNRCTYATFNYR